MTSETLTQILTQALLLLALSIIGATPAQARDKYQALHHFDGGTDGGVPVAGLTLDIEGKVFGTTIKGGTRADGTVFELVRGSNGQWAELVLHNFYYQADGSPTSALVFDDKGNLYGSARGGPNGVGDVFQMTHGGNGWTLQLIYDIGSEDGLITDKRSNFYGGLGYGKYGAGAFGELSPGVNGWTYTQLYSFCNSQTCPDGDGPVAPLTWDAGGNLYGTMLYGGNGPPKCGGLLGCGVAFQMTRNSNGTWKYHVLHRFADFQYDGRYPYAGLVVDKSGIVYGATDQGGRGAGGTIFKLTRSSGGRWKQTVLYDFPNCAEGCGPDTSLVFDKAGNLYGTAGGGLTSCGGYYCGVVYKLTPESNGKWKYSVLHKFTGQDGEGSNGLAIDSKGNLYGTTIAGGKYNYGVAFELTP